MSFKFLLIFQSISKKMSNYFKQKAPLEAFLTVDRASIRATNENAKLWN